MGCSSVFLSLLLILSVFFCVFVERGFRYTGVFLHSVRTFLLRFQHFEFGSKCRHIHPALKAVRSEGSLLNGAIVLSNFSIFNFRKEEARPFLFKASRTVFAATVEELGAQIRFIADPASGNAKTQRFFVHS